MIKLIATDMDGTLLNAAHEISQENVDARDNNCDRSCIL